jgi:hypothetical protein
VGRKKDRSRREQHEVDLEHIRALYALVGRVSPVLYIAALYIPIRASEPIARILAGTHTSFTMSIGINVAYSAAITVGGGALFLKTRKQSEEIQRLRDRLKEVGR